MSVVKSLKRFIENRRLPSWVQYIEGERAVERGRPHLADGYYEIDPDKAYPEFLARLRFNSLTQYELEVARRCFIEYLVTDLLRGEPAAVAIPAGSRRWALKNFSEGRGAAAGAAEFRQYYERLKI